MRILQRYLKQTTDTFLFISHTAKYSCSNFFAISLLVLECIKKNAGFGSEWDTLYNETNSIKKITTYYLVCLYLCESL